MLAVAIALETAVATTASPVVTDRDENTTRHELQTGECEEDLSEESDFPAQHGMSPLGQWHEGIARRRAPLTSWTFSLPTPVPLTSAREEGRR